MSSGYAADLRSREDQLRSGRQAFALATVVRALRPTSAKAGDRALVLPDGHIEGFVGGDCAEASVRLHALQVLATGEPVMLRIVPAEDMSSDDTADGVVTVANPCGSGGMLEIFLQGVFPPPLVQVHGDGPTARALRDLAAALGYQVDPMTPGGELQADATAVIVASHGRDEVPVLKAAISAGVPYVGLVASRKRGVQVLKSLDVSDDVGLSRVHTPAGLDIGARTPQEIALSIFAQLVAEHPRREDGRVMASPAAAGTETSSAPGPPTATDPVCGMSVAVTETTLKLPHDGGVWYFCGPGCRQAFADDPDRYLAHHGQGSGGSSA